MAHKKRGRKTRKHRKGGYYGATGAIAPGAMEWGKGSEMGEFAISSRGGNGQFGAGRKRRKTRRGGTRFGVATASFQGNGSRGLADYVPISTKGGVAQQGAFNNHGAQPGSGYGSFVRI